MVEVLQSGLFTTIQDLGRYGYSAYGVPVSGAMDRYSAQFANALLGNTDKDAVLEITMTGPKLLFKANVTICISGADMSPKLNGRVVLNHHPVSVNPDDVLSFGALKHGYRGYIAISGGFQTEVIMKSRSMYSNITSKDRIEAGDMLSILPKTTALQKHYASVKFDETVFSKKELFVFKGPEFDILSKSVQKRITSKPFTISKHNNRMGYQMDEIVENNLPSILTGPVLPGTVQLTPLGRLIVLMRDGQTTGGYPRVLQLKEDAINVLAQKKIGDSIQWILI